ncbi:hypothetical protein QJS83_08695 [Bdellovibrio sp. 22V]|uniref:hypothetical protein n=1 Tax=Bdellovibrio sp. 22V TaxID=3044166 RepID=UPI002543E813|nr:hypothetical protein [Bdellovibrio sp. 22V]WII70534.1 hypothetical protein QJS83_08695 [Bdellovibrio sp. 22V]
MNLKMFLSALLVTGVTITESSHAFLVANEPAQLQAGIPTDVFVAGEGGDLGDLFIKAAILGAKVSRDRFPQRQRLIISAVDDSVYHESAFLTEAGLHLRKADKEKLNKENLLALLNRYQVSISSLQFFAHSNPRVGMQLEGSSRLAPEDAEFTKLKQFLAPNAIAVFHSCNSAWVMAPAAAKIWNRPAFGSFTSDDFQEMMSDGKWYFHDEGFFPENLSRIGSTTSIVRERIKCSKLECLRMKPSNTLYRGAVGKFGRGLGFYKVFSTNTDKIPAALIHYTLLFPSVTPLSMQSSRKEFLTVVKDWMCPNDKSSQRREACSRAIDSGAFQTNPTLNFFNGEAIACNNIRCQTVVKCSNLKSAFGLASCKTQTLSESPSTVFSDQMKMIMKGLQMLEQRQMVL